MNFTPKSEKELKEQALWPAGEYDFEVLKSEPAKSGPQSKNPGTPFIKLILRVFNSDGAERMVNAILHPAMEWQLRSFCYETGLEKQYLAGNLVAEDCVGKAGKLQLKIKEAQGDFPAKNEVKDWGVKATKKKAEPSAPPANQPENSDDVPF